MKPADALRTLDALRTKREQEEEAAGKVLASAVEAHARAEDERRVAAAAVARADDALRAAREATDPRRGAVATVAALADAGRFAARRREEWAAAREGLVRAQAKVADGAKAIDWAQRALAEARGQREAVEKRAAALRDELRRAAEARAEDEAQDRAAAVRVPPRSRG
jgi:hypothetical protein